MEDFSSEKKQSLPISQRICAGEVGVQLEANTVARIFTGAPIPAGADTVIMQELCVRDGNSVKITGSFCAGANIRKAGEDINQGDLILTAGTKLRPQELGLAASVGISQLPVFETLKVAIFSTGDEIREPDEQLKAGQIYNSNRYTLTGLLQSLGCNIIDLGVGFFISSRTSAILNLSATNSINFSLLASIFLFSSLTSLSNTFFLALSSLNFL